MSTWHDKNGPVFRLSPNSAWPLDCDSDRSAKRRDAQRLDPQDESAVPERQSPRKRNHLKAVR